MEWHTKNSSHSDWCRPDTEYTITWTTNKTARDVASVNILYTTNGGVTWKKAGTVSGTESTYNWRTPSVGKTKKKCRVKVVLKDNKGLSLGQDASDAFFTINPAP